MKLQVPQQALLHLEAKAILEPELLEERLALYPRAFHRLCAIVEPPLRQQTGPQTPQIQILAAGLWLSQKQQ